MESVTLIIRLADEIPTLSRVEFYSRQHLSTDGGWQGSGTGEVIADVDRSAGYSVRLTERGTFTPDATGKSHPFHNVFRFTWVDDCLRLYHERRGAEEAVWLFDLVQDTEAVDQLKTATPHLCGQDTYDARLTHTEGGLELEWRIQGPRKDASLRYRYFRTT